MNISELSNRILKTLEQIRSSLYSIFENINFDPSQKENVSTQFGELEKDIIDIKKAVDSIEWEKKTIKKFHFNNTLLMIFPTIISIGLIIFTVMKAPQNRRMVNNLRAISAYQNLINNKQQNIISLQDSIFNIFPDSNLYLSKYKFLNFDSRAIRMDTIKLILSRQFMQRITILDKEIDSLLVEKRALEIVVNRK